MSNTGSRSEQLEYALGLAGGLIHEIKNPLNSLNLNLQLLAEDFRGAETPRERRALKRIHVLQSETQRLARTLDDFLSFVRGHPLALSACDINSLVDEVLTFMQPDLEARQINWRKSYAQIPLLRLDVALMKQTLMNLLLNAEEAVAESSPKEIIVRTAMQDDHVRLDVIDTGKGISPFDMEKIFEVFYSTRKGGTGLGLPMARRVVEEHGGKLIPHSEPGRGSCFSILLPIRSAAASRPQPAAGVKPS